MSVRPQLGGGAEFDRVRQIAAALGDVAGPLWDDTGTLPAGVGEVVASTDISVEGVHFECSWLAPEEIGWRATAAALSDLAAAAAVPAGVLVALTIPSGANEEFAAEVMKGAGGAARSVGALVIGGDLSRGPHVTVAVTVLGHAVMPVTRAGASIGDRLWVTGDLGGARAALMAWKDGRRPPAAARAAFAHPRARVKAARWLADRGATAMIDLSDGLAGDTGHLAAASDVALAVNLERVPVHPSVHTEAAHQDQTPVVFAACGGEDYELLVAMPPSFDDPAGLEAATGVTVRWIGRVVAGSGVRLLLGETDQSLSGFRHKF